MRTLTQLALARQDQLARLVEILGTPHGRRTHHALSFAVRALRPGGTFLAKVFQGDDYPGFLRRVAERFDGVKGVKPTASSATSAEIYVLAMGRR